MILEAAVAALGDLRRPELRRVLWKALGLTALALVLLWFGLRQAFDWLALPWIDTMVAALPDWAGWLSFFAALLFGLAAAAALAFLIAPATAIAAGFFLDDAAEAIEAHSYPADPPGRALPFSTALVQSLKFFGVVILGNVVGLLLLLVPGVNIAAFFLVNGYLLGREFFEFAAMRYRSAGEAKAMRHENRLTVFAAGLVIAAFLAIPLVNLATPLFAASMMVHLHKRLSGKKTGLKRQP